MLPEAHGAVYRVIDQGVVEGYDSSEAYGLNEKGQVVGRSFAGTEVAFAWLLNADYGQPAKEMLNLNILAEDDDDSGLQSKAFGININGIIVGRRNAAGLGAPIRASVWELCNGGDPCEVVLTVLGTMPCDGGCPSSNASEARAINDDNPPWIVGFSPVDVCENPCPCSGCQSCPSGSPVAVPRRGFRMEFDASPSLASTDMLTIDLVNLDNAITSALAVNLSNDAGGDTDLCNETAQSECSSTKADPGYWINSVNDGVELGTIFDCTSGNTTIKSRDLAQGMNDVNNLVGEGKQHTTCGSVCYRRAIFWEAPDAVPVNLHTLTSLGSTLETTAYDVNNPFEAESLCIQVVGENITEEEGLLWNRNGSGDWSVLVLNDIIWECSGNFFDIRSARAINDKGWIAGTADVDDSAALVLHAVLLLPVADLNLDGDVNSTDLGILLSSWSLPDPDEDPGCDDVTPCYSDLDCDGHVNSLDLGILLTQWGGFARSCPGGEESMMSSGGYASILTPTAIELIQGLLSSHQLEDAVTLIESLIEGSVSFD